VAVHDVTDNPVRRVADTPVLHWHGDTFTLPSDVELLASSHLYENQAFRRGNNILALQFHAEMGLDPRFEEWLERWPDAVTDAGHDAEDLRALHAALGPPAVAAGQTMIADWLERLD
jgi:GMP synthase (glutamine-hydrolysing)